MIKLNRSKLFAQMLPAKGKKIRWHFLFLMLFTTSIFFLLFILYNHSLDYHISIRFFSFLHTFFFIIPFLRISFFNFDFQIGKNSEDCKQSNFRKRNFGRYDKFQFITKNLLLRSRQIYVWK